MSSDGFSLRHDVMPLCLAHRLYRQAGTIQQNHVFQCAILAHIFQLYDRPECTDSFDFNMPSGPNAATASTSPQTESEEADHEAAQQHR